jgi:hypothetical protein
MSAVPEIGGRQPIAIDVEAGKSALRNKQRGASDDAT